MHSVTRKKTSALAIGKHRAGSQNIANGWSTSDKQVLLTLGQRLFGGVVMVKNCLIFGILYILRQPSNNCQSELHQPSIITIS